MPTDVPLELLAGACTEVWCGDGDDAVVAWRRHSAARRAWLREHQLDGAPTVELPEGLRRTGNPWSYRGLAEQDPDVLVQILADRGLPPDWRPLHPGSD